MKLLSKIRYRLVWNRARRLNRHGEGLVQIEMEQNGRRLYLSTHTYVADGMWQGGMVSEEHPLSAGLNTVLIRMKLECERVELDYIRQGVYPTVVMIRDAIREKMVPGVRMYDFIKNMMKTGQRKEHTRLGYKTLANSLERWRKGVLVSDVDYQSVGRYEDAMRARGLAGNTIIGRLRMLRAVMHEAVKRKIVEVSPFRQLPYRQDRGEAWLPYLQAA